MKKWPTTRRGWAGYYINRFNKFGYPGSEQLALFYLFLVEDEEWEGR